MTDALNDILVECCKMRCGHPLMHRTLREFEWFVNAVIIGADPRFAIWIEGAEEQGSEQLATLLRANRAEEDALRERFKSEYYRPGDDELLRLAEAFRIYCREEYTDDER